MKTYMEYMKEDGMPEEKIRKMVDGLFGAEAEMRFKEEQSDGISYDMGNYYILNCNNSACDTVDLIDEDGEVLESWMLEY